VLTKEDLFGIMFDNEHKVSIRMIEFRIMYVHHAGSWAGLIMLVVCKICITSESMIGRQAHMIA